MSTRLSVLKTYKLFIDGKFPRTESGRYLTAANPSTGAHLANYCQASKKDAREAVVAARKGAKAWAGATAYLKGQILYRLAEMMESREASLAQELIDSTGCTAAAAKAEVSLAIDAVVYYAGWTDKLSQVFGAVNPVASSHFNFTVPEPTGVVGVVAPNHPSLLGSVAMMAAVLAGGNAVILMPSESFPLPLVSLAEVIATSDVPAGVVNILSGPRAELVKTLSDHLDVNAMADGSADPALRKMLQLGVASNLKRLAVWDVDWKKSGSFQSPYLITKTLESKTAWHPIGI
jgi:acyl-CoA reductase-like NAD-dependent aldehyde dehydrogenase